jgi:TolA-binding protein
MTLRTNLLTALLLTSIPFAAWSADYLLYEPKEVAPSQSIPAPGSGVLVKKITINRGDTLTRIARREGGKGSYYPQMLLFNQINDPNLIYEGKTLYVPVTRTATAPSAAPHKAVSKKVKRHHKQSASHKRHSETSSDYSRQNDLQLFTKGVTAYRKGDCNTAIAHFDNFLRRNPDAQLAAEARLYRADCYLSLSSK